MNNASLELGGDNWAAKDTKLLASTVSDDSGRFYPREFTFARGSNLSATRVNADGLIEKGRENLLTYSNDFTNGAWSNFTEGVTRSASSVESPFGDTDTYSVIVNTGNNKHRVGRSTTIDSVSTFSIYAKANGYNYVRVWSFGGGNTNSKWFNLSDGTTGGAGQIASAIESVGNNWYRCSVVVDPNNSGAVVFSPAPDESTASGTSNYTGDGISGIYVTRGQFEVGLTATDYIETTATTAKAGILENEPRIDYSSGTASLLLEPQRTNLITQSEYLNGLSWAGKIGTSFDTNTTTSPEGLGNSALLKENSSNGSHFAYQDFNLTSGSTYTISLFAKSNGANRNLRFGDGGVGWSSGFNGVFNLTDGTATGGKFESMGNGWYRCSVTGTTNATTSRLIIYSLLGTATSYQGDGSSGVFLYGFQVEQGPYPTGYIPTYGTSQTRGADRPQILNTTTDVLSQTAFTLFFEADLTSDTINNFRDIVAFRGASKELRFETRTDNSVRVQSNMTTSGDNFNSATIGNTDNKKFAMTFTTSQVRLYADGSLVNTYNGAYSSDLVHILFMNSTSLGVETKTNFKQYLLFTSDLSNDECITLTKI